MYKSFSFSKQMLKINTYINLKINLFVDTINYFNNIVITVTIYSKYNKNFLFFNLTGENYIMGIYNSVK